MCHSVWLQEMGNSCKSVFPNTRAWEQQEPNKTKMQTKKVRREAGTKIICPDWECGKNV